MFALRPWRIARILGIPISIDPSWLIIFFLLTYQLAVFVFPAELGLGRRRGLAPLPIVLAVIASLLLFASVLAHELSHAYMAQKRGVPVLGITLFIFGGVAQIGDEPDSPMTEFLIAIMGPLMSLLIAIVAGAIWVWSQAVTGIIPETFGTLLPIAVVAFYLAQTNLLLALFNLLPGFPLDGGRVLRALLWAIFRDMRRATFWAMVAGRGIALLMLGGGGLLVVRGDVSGAWLFFIAWFLWRAAGESYHSIVARELLKHVNVGRLMRSPLQRVAAWLDLRQLVDHYLALRPAPVGVMEASGALVGLIGAEQVRHIQREKWDTTRVRDAMVPLAQGQTVTPEETALRALQLMTRREHDELVVMENGEVVGSIGRRELAHYLSTKGE